MHLLRIMCGTQIAQRLPDLWWRVYSAPHPAELLARILPGFKVKHGLRFVLENLAPDLAVDMAIANPLFRALARSVFYQRKRFLYLEESRQADSKNRA